MKAFGIIGLVLAAGLAATLSAQAAQPGAATASAASAYQLPPLDPAQTRGRAFAERRCSGCHDVGLDDAPSYGPRFRRIADQYDSATLARRFAEVSAHGVDRMPPIGFTRAEADDLVAYFATLHGAR